VVKAVMNGRTDEIIDLAKTNPWRCGVNYEGYDSLIAAAVAFAGRLGGSPA